LADKEQKAYPPADRPRPDRKGKELSQRSHIRKHSVHVDHKTTITMEGAFWEALKEIALVQTLKLQELMTIIDADRQHANLS
jgi:predicted DNA-binding ribbon-helix-helix protein